jgi:hypothetical protein
MTFVRIKVDRLEKQPTPFWGRERTNATTEDSLVSNVRVSMFVIGCGAKTMSESEESTRLLVENWLTDVRRRGAELYAMNEGDAVQYFSFEGKDHFRFSIEIDYAVEDITLHITDPKKGGIEIQEFALTPKNLEALARMMCSVKEGEAVVPVYLLAQLAVICHGYQRLVQELDQIHGINTSTGSVIDIEADLRRFLTPDEQKRTDNPLLSRRARLKG